MANLQVSVAEALGRAHKALLVDLRGLEHAVRSWEAPVAAEMHLRLERLRAHLTEHFRFEEEDGYLDGVVKREPHRRGVVQQLLEEHGQLARCLDALVEATVTDAPLDGSFRDKLRAWVAQVRHHESRENGLVQDAFNLDTAAED